MLENRAKLLPVVFAKSGLRKEVIQVFPSDIFVPLIGDTYEGIESLPIVMVERGLVRIGRELVEDPGQLLGQSGCHLSPGLDMQFPISAVLFVVGLQ